MVMMQTHSLTCDRCGWKAVWRGGDAIVLTLVSCPNCPGTLRIGTASSFDCLNPLYRLNYLRLLGGSGGGREG